MFFHAGARAAPCFPAPFRTWPHEGFGLQSEETPAVFGMSGDIRENTPQLLCFRRPGGRRGPHLPPCRGQTGKDRHALALLPSGRRGKGRGVRTLHRIVKEAAADPGSSLPLDAPEKPHEPGATSLPSRSGISPAVSSPRCYAKGSAIKSRKEAADNVFGRKKMPGGAICPRRKRPVLRGQGKQREPRDPPPPDGVPHRLRPLPENPDGNPARRPGRFRSRRRPFISSSALPRPNPSLSEKLRGPGDRRLLHRHALGEVSRLVDVGALEHRHVVGEQLQRNDLEDRAGKLTARRQEEDVRRLLGKA